MKAKIEKQIQAKTYNGSQSIYHTAIFQLSHTEMHRDPVRMVKKVKIEIRRDSYDRQSYARILVWNEAWIPVTSLDWKAAKSEAIFEQKKVETLSNSEIQYLTDDTNELLELASEIIF